MIGGIVFVLLAAFFALLSVVSARAKRHGFTIVFLLLGVSALIASVVIYPLSSKLEAEMTRAVEVERAKVMIETLGDAALYVEYLKATE
ncbi:hypothetical protein [Vibrio sonorensis]|uniref:hypothetical protein n=1 Tax=Vibrio sonorensis TaxID=1004316 RepID=UPI0008D94CDE|nr:hypothetical protein [Vibrio sonorensis]